jgi:hypothetical protein
MFTWCVIGLELYGNEEGPFHFCTNNEYNNPLLHTQTLFRNRHINIEQRGIRVTL